MGTSLARKRPASSRKGSGLPARRCSTKSKSVATSRSKPAPVSRSPLPSDPMLFKGDRSKKGKFKLAIRSHVYDHTALVTHSGKKVPVWSTFPGGLAGKPRRRPVQPSQWLASREFNVADLSSLSGEYLDNDSYSDWLHISYGPNYSQEFAEKVIGDFALRWKARGKFRDDIPLPHEAGLVKKLKSMEWSLGWAKQEHVQELHKAADFDRVQEGDKERKISDAEDCLIAWPLRTLRFAARDMIATQSDSESKGSNFGGFMMTGLLNSHPSGPHTMPANYFEQMSREGLSVSIIDREGPERPAHEQWDSSTGRFTFRQLRHILGLRYFYMDLDFLAHWHLNGSTLDGLHQVGKARDGQPIFEPVFGCEDPDKADLHE